MIYRALTYLVIKDLTNLINNDFSNAMMTNIYSNVDVRFEKRASDLDNHVVLNIDSIFNIVCSLGKHCHLPINLQFLLKSFYLQNTQ